MVDVCLSISIVAMSSVGDVCVVRGDGDGEYW